MRRPRVRRLGEAGCVCVEEAVVDSRRGVILEIGDWAEVHKSQS
jgi:hypothetical protein